MTIKYTDGSLGHWLKGYDTFTTEYLQVGLSYERLIREQHGRVRTISTKIFTTPDSKPIDDLFNALADLIGGTRVEALDSTGVEPKVMLFTGDLCVCHLAKPMGGRVFEDLFIADATEEVIGQALAVIETLGYTIGAKADIEGVIPVTFCTPSEGGVAYTHKEFTGLPLESIESNYTSDVIIAAKQAIAEAEGATSGIIILNGDPGTGKSYLIRALLTELKKRHAVICTPPARFLTNVSMLVQATNATEKASIAVLEDIGDLLALDNVSRHLDETSNFLNLTDGLLSLLMDTIFVVSFNHDMAKINPALTRPGRCLGQITVSDLPSAQAKELVGPTSDGTVQMDRRYTLAEVYEMKRTGKAIQYAQRSRMPGMGRQS